MLLCKWCGESKPDDLFVKRNRDQPFSQRNVRCCKDCNGDRNRRRYQDPAIRAKQLRASAAWRKSHPDEMRQHEKQFKLRRPNQEKARSRVKHMLRRGFWTRQPCEVCGKPQAEAHHDSYAQPHWETVRWLCKAHHEKWHQRLDPVKNGLLEEPMVGVVQLREQADEVQQQITALRDRFRELRRDADAKELAAWNRVVEAAQPLYEDFLKNPNAHLPSLVGAAPATGYPS